jgi:hypothetical protein
MIIQTDVKCLYCGQVSWRVEMEHGAKWATAEMVWPEMGGALPEHPRCTRCGGPVFLDGDFRQVRQRQSEARAKLHKIRVETGQPAVTPLPAAATAEPTPKKKARQSAA